MKLCPKCNKQFSDDANFCPVDAARLGPVLASASDSDSLSARFELKDKLGGARTGTVHRAKDKQSGATVAVKLVAPQVTALPGVGQRLERELKQLERVQSAGVTKLIASGKKGEQTWIALELVEGAQTLAEAITARGPIALDQAAHLIEVVGEALIEAAQVGVVHRDLAPKNVLFAGGDIKLVNFSLPVPTTERVPGVPEFVAPEQVEGKPVDQRSNLYSLGALYYYVLTGQTIHSGAAEEVHRAHVNGSIKTPSSLAPVPGPVEAVIMRALDRSPTKRFLTVRQFVDEVGRIARGEVDPKAMPAGKSRPKADLVQTLLGVRSGPGQTPVPAPAPAPTVAPVPVPAPAPAPQVPQAPVLPAAVGMVPLANPAAQVASLSSTVAGVPAGVALPTAALNAPPMVAPVAVAASLPSPDRSPWAPPGGLSQPGPAAAVTVAPEVAKPAAAATPVVAAEAKPAPAPAPAPAKPAAPVVAAPVVAQQKQAAPAGKKKSPEEKASKGKFRETMWFKKGDLDAQAAQAAAEERAKTGKDASADKADSLPIDERYKDDGSISRGDKEKYSLRTGATQMMAAMRKDGGAGASNRISEDALIDEMKGGRQWIFIGIGGAVLLIILIIVLTR
jgi:Protein kinase domain